jgi:hypothetical protein
MEISPRSREAEFVEAVAAVLRLSFTITGVSHSMEGLITC